MDQVIDHEVILARYAEGPTLLEGALAGLTGANLDRALSAESWTIRQIAQHVVDGDDLWKMCIKAALGNPQGLFTLQWYWDRPQTEWAQRWHYADRPLEPSLALFRANRQMIVEMVLRTPNAWARSIRIQPPNGEEQRISVGDVLESQSRHAAGHVEDIQAIRRAFGL